MSPIRVGLAGAGFISAEHADGFLKYPTRRGNSRGLRHKRRIAAKASGGMGSWKMVS